MGVSAITAVTSGALTSYPTLTPIQAYQLDSKIDDGYPTSGKSMAQYVTFDGEYWAAGGSSYAAENVGAPDNSATPPSAITCYDNNSTAGAQQKFTGAAIAKDNSNCAYSLAF